MKNKIIIALSVLLIAFMIFAGCKTIEDAVKESVEDSVKDAVTEEVSESVLKNFKIGQIPVGAPNYGQPDFTSKQGPLYFIWRDNNGWHIRIKSNQNNHVFNGKITTTEKISNFNKVGIPTLASIDKGNKEIKFTIPFKGKNTIGFDFKAGNGDVRFQTLSIDGNPIVMDKIVISRAMWSPLKVPFTLKPNGAPSF
ncbi:MAG: hypothetical protein PHV06_01325 [bacterium]|nr:hypothetical protein [bacterium]